MVRKSEEKVVRPSVTRFFIAEFKPKSDVTLLNAPAQRSQLMAGCRPCYLDARTHAQLDGQMDVQMDVQMDGRTDGQADGQT